LFGPVFKNGFVGLSLACLALTAAPAGAEQAKGRHTDAPAAPTEGEPGTRPEREPERQRVRIRSVSAPPTALVKAPAEPELAPVESAEPRATQPAEPRARADRPAPAPTAQPPGTEPSPAAAPPPSSKKPARPDERKAEPAAPREPLPVRVVPRQIRRIAEVVPGEIWAALAALALLALSLAASSWVAALRARRLRRQREELLQEVGLLQAALLPSVPADAPVSVAYRPADGATAGGDFYDAFTLADGRTGIILGDVSGHGRDALARTTFVRYTLRAYLEAELEPREVLKVGGAALAEHLDGGFATVVVALFDAASGRFTYASAGHPPPVVTGAHEPFEPVTVCSSPPLGIDEPTGFRQSTFTLIAGSRACLHTDGVVEARVGGRLLGLDRLERALESLPPDADADQLLDAVAEIADEVPDDMAVCLVTAPDDAPAAGPRIEELEVDEREVGDSLERFLRACGVPLIEVPGVLREAGEAARREGSATVRVRLGAFRPGVDVVTGNLVRLAERRRAVR
jgi:serine phosphatase RsbU (regulator of sigma subunit)